MQTAGSVFPEFFADLLRETPLDQAVRMAWPAVCGAKVAARTATREFAAGRLRVEVPDHAWRVQLTELELDYRREFARLLGKGKVERIVFETGEQAAVQAPSPKGKKKR